MQEIKRENSIFKARILEYLDSKGISKYECYQKTGMSRSVLSQPNGMTEDNVLKFLAVYKDINVEWFLTGVGSMLQKPNVKNSELSQSEKIKSADLQRKYSNSSVIIQEKNKKNILMSLISHYANGNKAQFASMLGVTPQTINTWISRNTFDAERILANCEDLSAEYLMTGEGEMLKSNIQEIGSITDSKNIGNQVGGKYNSMNIGDKSELAEEKQRRINQYENYFVDEVKLFRQELSKYHEVQLRKDEYIERIIKNSYDRNRENMDRLDEMIKQNRLLIECLIKKIG
jgi:transcriptional regulator with XRE-family HTH domain